MPRMVRSSVGVRTGPGETALTVTPLLANSRARLTVLLTNAALAAEYCGTIAKLAEHYLERYAMPRKKSWREDARIIANKLNPSFGNMRAQDVTRADVRMLCEKVAEHAPIEANRTLATCRKLYNWAISQDLVETNPCFQIPAPGQERRRDRVLSDDEICMVWKTWRMRSRG
jgi:site-specific recombinase XerD